MPDNQCSDRWNAVTNDRTAPFLSAAVSFGGRTVLSVSDGGEAEAAVRFGNETPMEIGALSGIFVGILAVLLAERGLLSLDDPVRTYLPAFPFADTTLLQLLTHSSGIDPFCCRWDRPLYRDAPDGRLPDTAVSALCGQLRRTREQGTDCRYFPFGDTLVLAVLQRVCRGTLTDFLKEAILLPLGMTHSYPEPREVPPEMRVPRFDDVTGCTEYGYDRVFIGCTGFSSTAEDLLLLADDLQAALHGRKSRVFSPRSARLCCRKITFGNSVRTPVFRCRGTGAESGFFSEFASPEALGCGFPGGCVLVLDPAFDISCAILTDGTAETEGLFRRTGNLLYGACGETVSDTKGS